MRKLSAHIISKKNLKTMQKSIFQKYQKRGRVSFSKLNHEETSSFDRDIAMSQRLVDVETSPNSSFIQFDIDRYKDEVFQSLSKME